jgi:hypothetical protein
MSAFHALSAGNTGQAPVGGFVVVVVVAGFDVVVVVVAFAVVVVVALIVVVVVFGGFVVVVRLRTRALTAVKCSGAGFDSTATYVTTIAVATTIAATCRFHVIIGLSAYHGVR